MSASSQNLLRSAPAMAGRFAVELFHELAPKVAFFFVAFALLFLLIKLFVEQYAIEFTVFTKAAAAALILGKVIALLDWAESGRRFSNYRRIVAIAIKTLIYAITVIILGIGERIFEAFRKQGTFQAAVSYLVDNANIQRFLGLVMLISLVVGAYLTMQEINRALGGEGSLYRLLFARPARQQE